jgi:hypothetical protein
MPKQGRMKNHSVRVESSLWDEFKEMTEALGSYPSARVVMLIERDVARWRKAQR